jgi:hypothetical protein
LIRVTASSSPSKRQASLCAMIPKSLSVSSRWRQANLILSDHVGHVFVVVRPLGVELILDMNAGDPSMDEFPDCTHRVQRLAETGAGIGDDRNLHRLGDVAGCSHCRQWFGGTARAAGYEAAIVDRLEPQALNQPAAERIIGDRHVDKALLGQKPAQFRSAIDHQCLPEEGGPEQLAGLTLSGVRHSVKVNQTSVWFLGLVIYPKGAGLWVALTTSSTLTGTSSSRWIFGTSI